jgi:hypothetical protein
MSRLLSLSAVVGSVLICGCTVMPTGPSVLVLPGSGKSFDQFRLDDSVCRQYAYEQVGGLTPAQAASQSAVSSAAVGTALGAATGAAVGGGEGAAVGAGTGLVGGSVAGAGAGAASGYDVQRRYDYGYVQCMYAKGHRVPVPAQFVAAPPRATNPPPPPAPPPSR